MSTGKHVCIIGAGIGGLTTAIRLAHAGFDVDIYEKNTQVGGKMGSYEDNGFRWDTGPSVITMRHVFEELFATVNRQLDDYITLLPLDPLTRYFYPDGVIFDASSHLPEITKSISALNERDLEGYLSYLAYAAQIHRVTGPVFIYDEPPTLRDFARVPIQDWLKADPLRTMQQAIEAHVKSPHLRQLLGRFATYVGGSPYEAPATLNVIAHVELNGGVWYPKGGVYSIARALEKLASELGVRIHKNCQIRQIIVKDKAVKGLILENGTEIFADAIVSNLDVTTTYDRLLSNTSSIQKRLSQLKQFEPSCSGFVMLLGVEGNYPQLAHHNIFFSSDYKTEFREIFKQRIPPTEPTIYVSITAKSDPDHAPHNCENWFILVNAPALTEHIDWDTIKEDYAVRILDHLSEFGIKIKDRIQTKKILTPLDLEHMTGAFRGALYGASANSKWTAFRRPHNRNADIKGLYFVGGTTHPGGGVPMVTLSGKITAQMVIDDIVNI